MTTFIGSWVNEKRRGNGRALKTQPRKLKESESGLEQTPWFMGEKAKSANAKCDEVQIAPGLIMQLRMRSESTTNG